MTTNNGSLNKVELARSNQHSDHLNERLKDLSYAVDYLNASLESGRQDEFLLALRNVVRAQGGFELTAEGAEMGRTALYRMLSEDGNPRCDSLLALFGQLGLRMTLSAA